MLGRGGEGAFGGEYLKATRKTPLYQFLDLFPSVGKIRQKNLETPNSQHLGYAELAIQPDAFVSP